MFQSPVSKRACDVCRRRKVKCDGVVPVCSTCATIGMTCRYAESPKKRGPKIAKAHARHADAESQGVNVSIPHSQESACRSDSGAGSLNEYVARLPLTDLDAASMSVASPADRHQSSPFATASTPSSSPRRADILKRAAIDIYDGLLLHVSAAGDSRGFDYIITECVSRHARNSFVYGPLYHEPSVRALAKFLSSEAATPGQLATSSRLGTECWVDLLSSLRDITLIMAVCARVALDTPRDQQPVTSRAVGEEFLHASEEMLKAFQKWDIEHPVATSLTIRSLLAATYHAIGRQNLSWHFHCQARLMAIGLRLYSEDTLSRHEPLEGQLLRMNFGFLYRSERAIFILSNQPLLLQPAMIDGEVDVALVGQTRVSLLDPTQKHNTPEFEERLFIGYDLYQRLWSSATDFMLAIKHHQRFSNNTTLAANELEKLTNLYFTFIGVLDNLPPWLQNPNAVTSNDEEVALRHRFSFWVQRANLTISFHCIKMIMLRRCIDTKATTCMGLSDQPAMLDMKKTEIAGDFLNELSLVPFEALRLNGEPCVEKLRQVGAALLEMTESSGSQSVLTRCKTYLARLLDVLALLDSRVSDELSARDHTS